MEYTAARAGSSSVSQGTRGPYHAHTTHGARARAPVCGPCSRVRESNAPGKGDYIINVVTALRLFAPGGRAAEETR